MIERSRVRVPGGAAGDLFLLQSRFSVPALISVARTRSRSFYETEGGR